MVPHFVGGWWGGPEVGLERLSVVLWCPTLFCCGRDAGRCAARRDSGPSLEQHPMQRRCLRLLVVGRWQSEVGLGCLSVVLWCPTLLVVGGSDR